MSSVIKSFSYIVLAVFFAGESHALTLGQAAQIAQTATPAAFNTIELVAPVSAASHVPQWSRAKAAMQQDVAVLESCLQSRGNCQGQAMENWRAMVVAARHQDETTQLDVVNRFFNQWAYVTDSSNYGTSEYWAGPIEFMKNSGDCEDYAIAKYVTLKFLGYTDQQMRITAVIDNSRGGIGHAVLTVGGMSGKMILDNQSNYVYSDIQQTAYAPRFAVNDSGVYTYAVQQQMMVASAQ